MKTNARAEAIQTEYHIIGPHEEPYTIAEVGLNHNGDLETAIRMTEAAARAGASAVKFQLYHSDRFIQGEARLGDGEPGSLREFFRQFELSQEEWMRLRKEVRDLGIDFLCSVFDDLSVELYRDLSPSLVKIASADITNRLLFEEVNRLRLPVLLSTGTASEDEVERSVHWIDPSLPILLFQCVSTYPAPPEDFHLRVIPAWIDRYGPLVGLSDHSEGNALSLAAVALGAVAIERHFTLDRNMEGPDQKLSLEPDELAALVRDANQIRKSLGDGRKHHIESETPVRLHGRRSLAALREIQAGSMVTREDLTALRPGGGMDPAEYQSLLGKHARRNIHEGEFLSLDFFE